VFKFALTTETPMSGNWLSNCSISSSPVTFTSLCGGGVEKSSKSAKLDELVWWDKGGAPPRVGVGMSLEPSNEISGKAEAARSKSMSSPEENWPPRSSLSLERKSVMVPSSAL